MSRIANARELNTEPTTDAQGFDNKTHQTVGRPPVTDHNINDEYMRTHSASSNIETTGSRTANPGKKEGAFDVEPAEVGVTGEGMGGGRQQPFQLINAEETSIHPNNPPQ